ncbi:MAG: TniQ family protein [Methylotenera sp.]|nr:TniQ family protein [Methylotenera sp.]MDP2404288.1 TniQ family protein [Methylotenera sp.]MDP3095951.1 TniQ family protein [Methylotenera sp.]MDZ4223635.1 TniQ family protein [Methylotenera sp.]
MYDLESKTQQVTQAKHGLHIPMLMPDEFFMGYLGRLTLINGLGNTSNTNKILSSWVKQSQPEASVVPAAYSLPKLLGIDVETFIKQHTLAPITSAIKSKAAQSNAKVTARQISNLQGMLIVTSKKIKKAACFCASCVSEDIDYLGFSFWRRSHQLSGIDWCLKHNVPLCEVNEDAPYAIQPANYLMNKRFTEVNIESHTTHPVVLRYAQLIQDALDLTVPLDFKVTGQVLFKQSKEFNIRASAKGNKKTLSDLMIEQLPDYWLSKHFPNLKKERHGTYLSSFDDVLRLNDNGKSCVNTLLAAAVLFENANEAMFEFTQHQYKLRRTFKSKATDESIIQSYIKFQGNLERVAAELNQNYDTLYVNAKRLGLPALTNVNQVTFDAIMSFFHGEDFLTLINKPGVNPEKFQNVIRTAGRQLSSKMKKFKHSGYTISSGISSGLFKENC